MADATALDLGSLAASLPDGAVDQEEAAAPSEFPPQLRRKMSLQPEDAAIASMKLAKLQGRRRAHAIDALRRREAESQSDSNSLIDAVAKSS
jgi:hypothetical protein